MYCPKCGQQQLADTTRFCSRCGLPIHGLPEWIERSGVPLAGDHAGSPVAASPKRVGTRRGAKLIFLSVVLFPIFLGLSFLFDSLGPLFVPFTVFLAGLSLVLYNLIFGEEIPRAVSLPTRPAELRSASAKNALGPGTDNWTSGVGVGGGRPVSTSELAQPPSVTEHTTKLLVDD
jgi:hypothetical protein